VERIWLESYQKGVPAEVDLSEFQSLGELFERSVAQYRERVAYINMGVEITYGQLDKLSRDFAAYLQSVLMLPPDATAERVAEFRRDWGFDDPIIVQYGRFLGRAVQGDMGTSLRHGTPALPLIADLDAILQRAAA